MAANIIINGNAHYIDVMSISSVKNLSQFIRPTPSTQQHSAADFNNNNTINLSANRSRQDIMMYSFLYVGWGAISYRDKVQNNIKWSKSYLKPYISSLYSHFISLPLRFESTLYYSPSQHLSSLISLASSQSPSAYPTKPFTESTKQGKRSLNDISDWQSVQGASDNDPNGLSFVIAGNCSHLSKELNLFPYSHLSDGYMDLIISTQTQKNKLLPWVFSPTPHQNVQFSNCENINNTSSTTTGHYSNSSSSGGRLTNQDSSLEYCKTREFILQIKNQDIPLTVDGEVIEVKERFGYHCDILIIDSLISPLSVLLCFPIFAILEPIGITKLFRAR
eukprot:gene11925-13893_t